MDMTQDWSVAQWRLDPPFTEAVRHVHSPLCGDHPHVVAGVGNPDQSVAALRWAGWEAQLRGTHLHVVNAWEPRGFQARVQRKQRQRQARRLMRQTLDGAFPQYSGHVAPVTAGTRPADVLAAASHGAAMLVLASYKRGPFADVFASAARRGLTAHSPPGTHCAGPRRRLGTAAPSSRSCRWLPSSRGRRLRTCRMTKTRCWPVCSARSWSGRWPG